MKNLATLALIALLNGIAFAAPSNDGIDPTKKEFQKWSRQTFAYPENADLTNLQEGVVYVSFELTAEGYADNILIESGMSEVINQKAIEIVNEMPKQHLYENGFFEGTRFIIPVKFDIK